MNRNFAIYADSQNGRCVPSLVIRAEIDETTDGVLVKQATLVSSGGDVVLDLGDGETQRLLELSVGREFCNHELVFGVVA